MRYIAPNPLRALVVDDEPEIVEFVSNLLASSGWEVRTASSGDEALAEARSFRPDLLFLDVTIPRQSGWLVCAKLKLFGRGPAVVFMTGLSQRRLAASAALVGASDLLRKPFSPKDVLRVANQFAPAS